MQKKTIHNITQYCEILLKFKITVFYLDIFQHVFYSCDGKAEFSVSLQNFLLSLC